MVSQWDVPPLPPKRSDAFEMFNYNNNNNNNTYNNQSRASREDLLQNDRKYPDQPLVQDPFQNTFQNQNTFQDPFHDPFQDPQVNGNGPRTAKSKMVLWRKLMKKTPWCTYVISILQICIFIYELAKMKQLTGSVIQTEPYFNPMIGPSQYVQIYIGARFTPCMHEIPDITTDLSLAWPCPNTTTTDTQVCSLSELCNSNEVQPTQTWRILSACFLHAGFVHIFFNLLLQLIIGREVEKLIGSLRYLAVYVISGLSGNVFGMNFAGNGIASSGASGALFGVIGVNLIIFVLHKHRESVRNYKTLVTVLVVEIIVCLVLGLLPGLDNFAHIGGFVAGTLLSIVLLNNPNFTHIKKITKEEIKFSWRFDYDNMEVRKFILWTCLRVLCLGLLVAWFVALSLNFAKHGGGNCSWCKYLSCIPVNDWCSSGDLTTN